MHEDLKLYVADRNNLKDYIKVAIDSELYIKKEGYELIELYEKALKGHTDEVFITIAYKDNIAVGVVFVYNWLICFFVKREYRRQKVATKLYKNLIETYPDLSFKLADKGIRGSIKFFRSIGVGYFPHPHLDHIVDDPKFLYDVTHGYAGGLSPFNIVESIKHIQLANSITDMGTASGTPYWIDMESGIRSPTLYRTRFDFNKVKQVTDLVYLE